MQEGHASGSYLHLFVAHNITPSACFWMHLLDARPPGKKVRKATSVVRAIERAAIIANPQ